MPRMAPIPCPWHGGQHFKRFNNDYYLPHFIFNRQIANNIIYKDYDLCWSIDMAMQKAHTNHSPRHVSTSLRVTWYGSQLAAGRRSSK